MSKLQCRAFRTGLRLRYAHCKLDGHYVEIVKHDRLHVYTSTDREITHLLRHHDWFQRLAARLPTSHRIAGELWLPGKTSTDVPTAIANEADDLLFSAFAAFCVAENAPLEIVERYFTSHIGTSFAPFHTIVSEDVDGFLICNPVVLGEGWVFKSGNRSDWYKWKPVNTADCVVIGFTQGNGKYAGKIGSLVVGVYEDDGRKMREVAQVSGMTDAERDEFTTSIAAYLGRVVEIEYQFVYKDTLTLRHPRYVRLRDDKKAKECTVHQLISTSDERIQP